MGASISWSTSPAAVFSATSLKNFPLHHWRVIIDANLTATFLCCRAVTVLMKNQKSGAIVNISSDIAFSGGETRSAYAAAKAGILGLTRTLAIELAPAGVRVNAVAPGRIETAKVRATTATPNGKSTNASPSATPAPSKMSPKLSLT